MKRLPLFLLALSVAFFSCDSSNKYDIHAADKYENSKETLADTEKKNPDRFLKVESRDKRNLFGQTIVKGTLTNTAKVISFKDVDIKLSFYSKTGALLEEDQEVIYETVSPGASKNFKTKYFAPKGTDSVAIKVLSAKY